MNKTKKKSSSPALNGVICLVIVIGFFAYLGISMGMANMLNTVMKTAHDLLINTVFYLMSICVLMGAQPPVRRVRGGIHSGETAPTADEAAVQPSGSRLAGCRDDIPVGQPGDHLAVKGQEIQQIFQEVPADFPDQFRNGVRNGTHRDRLYDGARLLQGVVDRPFRGVLRLHRLHKAYAEIHAESFPSVPYRGGLRRH